ncbi:MAG: 3-mercaptopyruvate sulfurtransferase [Rhodobacteraceae bacterium]|nr:3-mercaptopyruvate sulfurtransferase [Paracoccaceae bacterium]
MCDDTGTLVSTEWLADHVHDPDLRILDGSWYLPDDRRDCLAEYSRHHIPGAQFFDIDDIADTKSDLPHMVPPVDVFTSKVRSMGISNGHQVIVYDTAGLLSAARVWWLFRLMGHDHVAVLNGGLRKWFRENRPVDDLPARYQDRHFTVRRRSCFLSTIDDVRQASDTCRSVIVDARPAGRFNGTAPEPRDIPSGSIPGSRNLPFGNLLNEDGTMKPGPELVGAFRQEGVDLNQPIITTCGSGVTAAILSLALKVIGHQCHSLYDGAWVEWAEANRV